MPSRNHEAILISAILALAGLGALGWKIATRHKLPRVAISFFDFRDTLVKQHPYAVMAEDTMNNGDFEDKNAIRDFSRFLPPESPYLSLGSNNCGGVQLILRHVSDPRRRFSLQMLVLKEQVVYVEYKCAREMDRKEICKMLSDLGIDHRESR